MCCREDKEPEVYKGLVQSQHPKTKIGSNSEKERQRQRQRQGEGKRWKLLGGDLFHEFIDNSRIWKQQLQLIEASKPMAEYQSGVEQLDFPSIARAGDNLQGDIDVSCFLQLINQPFVLSIQYFRSCKVLIWEIQHCLWGLEQVILHGSRVDGREFKGSRSGERGMFGTDGKATMDIIEKLIGQVVQNSLTKNQVMNDREERDSLKLSQTSMNKQIEELKGKILVLEQKTKETEEIMTPPANQNKEDIRIVEEYSIKEQGRNTAIEREREEEAQKDKLVEMERQLRSQEKAITRLNQQDSQQRMVIEQIRQQNASRLQQQQQKHLQEVQSHQDKALQLETTIKKYKEENDSLIKTNQELTQQQQFIATEAETRSKADTPSKQGINQLTKLIGQKEEENASKNNLIYSLQQQLTSQSTEISELRHLNSQLAESLQNLKGICRSRTKSFVEHKTLLIGDLLETKKKEKQYLLSTISTFMDRKIQKTRLLFQFRKDQKTNFHSLIDGHSNLVTVIETSKGLLVAGFYSGVYAEKTMMKEEGLLLSLTNCESYVLNNSRNNPKIKNEGRSVLGMNYDSYFLIYGNSELRVKSGERRLYSNFGVNSAYFNSRGQSVNAMLGEGKTNDVELVNYEIHELIWETPTELIHNL